MKNQITHLPRVNPEIISYHFLRRAVGIIGMALPFALLIGLPLIGNCFEVEPSISKYYHTIMRNVFVGSLCAVALFLFSYRGHKRKPTDKMIDIGDKWAGNLAAIFALGVAFFPTYIGPDDLTLCITQVYKREIIGKIHLISALLFFLMLAYISIVLFTKGKKKKKNLLYIICGCIILLCMAILVVYVEFLKKPGSVFERWKFIFILETVALISFGISWLVKGRIDVIYDLTLRRIRRRLKK